jgi:hypothetical protein
MTGRPAGRAVAVLALALALALPGCLGGDDGDAPPPQAGPLGASAKLQSSTCTDWRRASLRERMLTVDRLEEVVAGPRNVGHTLADDRAYDILDSRCENSYARGFLLYEIYTRAAGFDSLTGGG